MADFSSKTPYNTPTTPQQTASSPLPTDSLTTSPLYGGNRPGSPRHQRPGSALRRQGSQPNLKHASYPGSPLSSQSHLAGVAMGNVTSDSNGQLDSQRQRPITCTGHTRPVTDVCYSDFIHTGDCYVISGCKDSVAMLRHGATGAFVGSFQGHKGAIWSSKISRDASISVTGSADFSAKVWANNTGTCILDLPHKHVVKSVDLSLDNRWVMTAGMEKKIRLFDIASATPTVPFREYTDIHHDIKCAMVDSTFGLVFAGDGKELKIWDLREQASIGTRSFESDITSIRFNHDRRMIICTAGKTIHFFDTMTSQLIKSIPTRVDVACAVLHPLMDKIVVGGQHDLWIRVYDFNTGQEMEVYKGHHGPIHCVDYSPDGQVYASGSEDGTVRQVDDKRIMLDYGKRILALVMLDGPSSLLDKSCTLIPQGQLCR